MASKGSEQEPRSAVPSAAPASVVAESGTPMMSAEQYAATVQDEYGDYVATEPIYVGNALAYNVGDPVPKSNVSAHGYDQTGQVARRSQRAGADAAGAQAEPSGLS
jgi:hypothetical protein